MNSKTEHSVGIVPTRRVRVVEQDSPLELKSGKTLAPVDVAYETYGRLNDKRDNAVLICHALSGDAHAAGYHSKTDRKAGWWDSMIGPGKAIDTDKYYVICSNFLGGCSGTTGPSSENPATGKPYGLDFPIITIADMVHVQKLLLDKLGIEQLLGVIGGSMGGMQALQWAIEYPDMVRATLPVATCASLSAQAIAFDAVGRNAILADPHFTEGSYIANNGPDRGLAIARMIGHITYLSEKGMREKFGRELRKAEAYSYDFDSEFSVETYLDYQGRRFIERFDANSYLYITKAMDYFDLKRDYGSLEQAFAKVSSRFLITSFTSDWLFPPERSEDMVNALTACQKDVSFCNLDSPFGHDSFLLETERLGAFVGGFLEATHRGTIDVEIKQGEAAVDYSKFSRFEHAHRARVDHELIESLIKPGSRVLDVGCGDGELLAVLYSNKDAHGEGIELQEDMVLSCVRRGIGAMQYDIERGLASYRDNAFDYVVLSQTVQTIFDLESVFEELLRVGKKMIVSFPNFGHWRSRIQLLAGRAPVTKLLPFEWYNTPNIHVLTLKDFDDFCLKQGVRVEKRMPLIGSYLSPVRFAPNLLAEQAVYVISKKERRLTERT